jgi:hypothetical protein
MAKIIVPQPIWPSLTVFTASGEAFDIKPTIDKEGKATYDTRNLNPDLANKALAHVNSFVASEKLVDPGKKASVIKASLPPRAAVVK